MEWYLVLLLFIGGVLFLMLLGIEVAFSFLLISLGAMFLFWGGQVAVEQRVASFFGSVSTFTIIALPLFILMGEVMFRSGIGMKMMDVLDKWLGRVPGRLGLLAVGGGTIFATLSGASMASIALLGSVLSPEVEKRGYKKSMSLGPILGSGGLAIMIPPSGLAVLLGAIGEISIGKILVAILIPGLLMAVLYAGYIIIRCWLEPSIAPAYEVTPTPLSEKLVGTALYVLPLGFIIFMILGFIFLGVTTPTEAAATGTLGTFVLAACYRKLNWDMVKKSFSGTLEITAMLFLIIVGAKSFCEVLAFSGASAGLVGFTEGLPVSPILIIISVLAVSIFLGMFMGVVSIMMIILPLFVPVVILLGFDPVWFAVMFLLTLEMGTTSPPFGLSLFVMQTVAPAGTTMSDIYKAALPFLGCDLIALVLILAFPVIALWIPMLMR